MEINQQRFRILLPWDYTPKADFWMIKSQILDQNIGLFLLYCYIATVGLPSLIAITVWKKEAQKTTGTWGYTIKCTWSLTKIFFCSLYLDTCSLMSYWCFLFSSWMNLCQDLTEDKKDLSSKGLCYNCQYIWNCHTNILTCLEFRLRQRHFERHVKKCTSFYSNCMQ